MLAAYSLLKSLSECDPFKHESKNEDCALSEVLKFFGNKPTKRKLRCSDGIERIFNFNRGE